MNHDSKKLSKGWCKYFQKHQSLLFHEKFCDDKALFIVTATYRKMKPTLPSLSRATLAGNIVFLNHDSKITTQSSRPSLLLEDKERGAGAKASAGGETLGDSGLALPVSPESDLAGKGPPPVTPSPQIFTDTLVRVCRLDCWKQLAEGRPEAFLSFDYVNWVCRQ